MRLLVTICTRNRPKLLEVCLRSVTASTVPAGVECAIAVIENNHEITCAAQVERIARETGWNIFAVLEPELGLPFARNRCGITAPSAAMIGCFTSTMTRKRRRAGSKP